jgi:16S rRNA (guanine1207-N2)-methyltransferase
MSDALDALLYPFSKGILALPDRRRSVLIRAEASPNLGSFERIPMLCEQTLKPDCDRLKALGFDVVRRAEGTFAAALCVLTKHKAENLSNIARAWSLIEPGGLLVCSGAKDIGAASIEGRVRKVLGDLDAVSKNHCRVFWTRRWTDAVPRTFAEWQTEGDVQIAPHTGFLSRPGIYGWDKIDEGSRLLAKHITARVGGAVADLGVGWGYLSLEVLKRCPEVASIDLYEAEWLALDAARANIELRAAGRVARYHWHDVACGVPSGLYDWVVTNPPFHTGKATDVGVGRAFIGAAFTALAPGGTLLMVANRHLPYEAALARQFQSSRVIAQSSKFKVFEARR